MGHGGAVVAAATAATQGRPPARGRPQGADRHPVRPEVRHPLGDAAAGDGLWLGHDLLAPAARLAAGRGMAEAAPAPARPAGPGAIDWGRCSLDSASVTAKRAASLPRLQA